MSQEAVLIECLPLGPNMSLLEFLSYDRRTITQNMVCQPQPVEEFPESTRYVPLPAHGDDASLLSAIAVANRSAALVRKTQKAKKQKAPPSRTGGKIKPPISSPKMMAYSNSLVSTASFLQNQPLMQLQIKTKLSPVELAPPSGMVPSPTSSSGRQKKSPFVPISSTPDAEGPTISPALLNAVAAAAFSPKNYYDSVNGAPTPPASNQSTPSRSPATHRQAKGSSKVKPKGSTPQNVASAPPTTLNSFSNWFSPIPDSPLSPEAPSIFK